MTQRGWTIPLLAAVLLMTQGMLLAWQAWRDSPTYDEVGHFAGGVDIWRHGRFPVYAVNPPLVRAIALTPVIAIDHNIGFSETFSRNVAFDRPEFAIGPQLAREYGQRYFFLMTLARWACIPFALLGGMICFRWASELFGQPAGLLALVFWAFSPTVLGHGHLITPDVGTTATGVWAAWRLRRWLTAPRWKYAFAAGLTLGLAELSKSTWIILFGLWPIIWVLWAFASPLRPTARQWFAQGFQLSVALITALWVLNLGYAFQGTFTPLSDYHFTSNTMRRIAGSDGAHPWQARTAPKTWLGQIPVPLPYDYVCGIDIQKKDFEGKAMSYLNGQWRLGGWWYYYLYAMLIKEPLGNWALGGIALIALIVHRRYRLSLREELVLLLPALAVLTLVSSETGFNHHLRYVLPAFPFLFIWISRAAVSWNAGHRPLAGAVGALAAWSVASSLWVFPHSLSYFNELVGGPTKGHFHLANSNFDWGQDLLYLRDWYSAHPQARPFHLAYDNGMIDPSMAGIESADLPVGPQSSSARSYSPDELGPLPGWFAVSGNQLHRPDQNFDYFLKFQPAATAGYSIYIYHITPDEADRARRGLGLPPLPSKSTAAAKGGAK